MRAPTSSTAISICCCSPRSIVRCSGSVRLRGGTSPGWRNWPRSSATPPRSKSSRTGCLTPRSCSIWFSTSGARRRVSKWQGPARSAAGWSAFSRRPLRLQSSAGANASGRRSSFCRLSSFRPARSPTACRRSPRRRSTAPRMRPRRASTSRFPSTRWAGRRSSRFFARAMICSDRSGGSESSVWPRRVTAPTPTRPRLARSRWPSMNGKRPFRCFVKMAATPAPSGRPNYRAEESRPMPACSIPMSAGISSERTAFSPSPATGSGFRSGRPDGRNSRS